MWRSESSDGPQGAAYLVWAEFAGSTAKSILKSGAVTPRWGREDGAGTGEDEAERGARVPPGLARLLKKY